MKKIKRHHKVKSNRRRKIRRSSSRRQGGLDIDLGARPSKKSVHIVVNSTGVKVYGEGEWLSPEKHSRECDISIQEGYWTKAKSSRD
ncbi:MAG: transposase [bacterium]